jgi:hypothetical protein
MGVGVVMIGRVLGGVLGWAVFALLVSSFVSDFYHRYKFGRLADPAVREAPLQRYGSPRALNRDLTLRCEAIYGLGDPNCARYRLALRDSTHIPDGRKGHSES